MTKPFSIWSFQLVFKLSPLQTKRERSFLDVYGENSFKHGVVETILFDRTELVYE